MTHTRLGATALALLFAAACGGDDGQPFFPGADTGGSVADAGAGAADAASDGGTADTSAPDASEPGEMPSPDELELTGACDQAERWGGFRVQAEESYSYVQGEVADGVVPGDVLEETLREGGCTLLKRNNPFCDPGCQPGEACDFTGECVPYPVPQLLGVVTVEGLVQPVEMTPPEFGGNYFDATLPHPATVPDETIRLRVAGDVLPGFTLHGVGVEPIEVAEGTEWFVQEGEDLEVTWAPPTGGAYGQVRLSLNIDQHGLSPTTMFCVVPDTGAASIPAAVVDGLIGAGVTGFPTGTVERQTADSTTLEGGCADFVVASSTTVAVDVDGFTPCNLDNPCPEGLECNYVIEICE